MIAVVLLLTALSSGMLLSNSNQKVPTNGTILTINVGAYTNSQCTINCTSIDWSMIEPGGSINRTIYIKNSGTIPVTLNLTSQNWTPSNASSYMTLTWDKEGSILAAGSSTAATISLSVSHSITGITTFSFNIVITGTQV